MELRDFQKLIDAKYGKRDRQRGTPAAYMWFIEEVGELATALHGSDQAEKEGEFADVLAWLCTLANINGVDLEEACKKYTERGVEGFK